MKSATMLKIVSNSMLTMFFAGSTLLVHDAIGAEQMTAETKLKVQEYKALLATWAADPRLIKAAKKSSKRGGIAGMSNAKWDGLSNNHAVVKKLSGNEAAKLITEWEKNTEIEKLNLRDIKGNLVAFSSHADKPILYNIANRNTFLGGIKAAWSANEVKPDPTTQKNSVQISAPIMDGDKVVGVLHSAVAVK